MAGPNFLSSLFLFPFAKFLLYLLPNLYGSQHDYVDFGLNETFACKKAAKVGFEAFYRSSRFRIAHGGMSKVTSNKKMSMRFLLSMLLLNGNVETNPEPQYKYPCGDCAKPVKCNQKGIQCDMCDIWYHARCCVMNGHIYDSLANSSCVWICTSCGLPNFSTSLFDSIHSINTSNSFQPLAESPIETRSGSIDTSSGSIDTSIGLPVSTSSPCAKHSKKRSLSILTVNCQSVLPDLIIGSETWLTKNHCIGEILIADMYEIERRDRGTDPHGGVFIAVKKDLIATREPELETGCEIMWCKLQISGKETLHIGAYYRPHENDEEALLELERSLSLVNVNHHILLAGDVNLPGWDWKENIVKPCNDPSLHYQFGDILDDNNLTQVVELPTRNQNILDLVITNNPKSVKNVSVIYQVYQTMTALLWS
ncbi:uncharacterized protein [Montipora foliosa]|uniref:uncharacterized protein n=1 Tax=Montipora foliosa TaxID=591990 RepID=UPI0035F1CA5D